MNSPGDIIENLRLVTPPDPWWWMRTIGLGLAVIALVVFLGWRLYRTGRLPFLQSAIILPETTALERLLAIQELIAAGRGREFSEVASDILRIYIEARFALHAPRLSTEEFLFLAEQSRELEESDRRRLGEFLLQCDKVKFALDALDPAQMTSLREAAVQFVTRTALSSNRKADQPAVAT